MFSRHARVIRRLRVIKLPLMQHEGQWDQRDDQIQAMRTAVPELFDDREVITTATSTILWESFKAVDQNLNALQMFNIFNLPHLQSLVLKGRSTDDFRSVYNKLLQYSPHNTHTNLPSSPTQIKHLQLLLTMPNRPPVIADDAAADTLSDGQLLSMLIFHWRTLITLDIIFPSGSLWNNDTCMSILTNMTQLRSLNISSSDGPVQTVTVTNNVEVDEMNLLQDYFLSSSTPKSLSLRILSLSQLNLGDVQLCLILANSPNIIDVKFSQCSSMSLLALFLLAQFSNRVAQIHVKECYDVRVTQEEVITSEIRIAQIISLLPSSILRSSATLQLNKLVHVHLSFPSMSHDAAAAPLQLLPCELDGFGVQWLASEWLINSPLKFLGIFSTHLLDSHILNFVVLRHLEILYWPRLIERLERQDGYMRAKKLYDEGFMVNGQTFTVNANDRMIITNNAMLMSDHYEDGLLDEIDDNSIALSFLKHCCYYGYRMFTNGAHTRAQYFRALQSIVDTSGIIQ